MDILFLTTELSPYVRVGGLADVSSALPKNLRMLGHSVTVLLPRFPALEAGGLLVARRLTPLKVELGARSFDVTVFDGRLASQVDLTLVDVPGLFDRPGVYGENGEDYPDNSLRFALLSKVAAELAKQRALSGRPFDILHVNDWPTALAPTYLQQMAAVEPALQHTKTVLTIHNVAHQGLFPKEIFPTLGLPSEFFGIDGMEFYGGINFLKQGIFSAHAITTVSDNYAREIQTEAYGHRLDGVLRARSATLFGIRNGVDYSVWNPATDSAVAARYDAEDPANKARCRGALQKEVGLPLDAHVPLLASVGRVVEQKGSDLLAAVIPKLLRATDAQMIVAGEGDPSLEKKLESAASKSHGRVVFLKGESDATVHRILAGADIVLSPSRWEPCGLLPMYAQRYGAPPVARGTGGLVDTIVDADAKLETGTGFLFQEDSVAELLGATERAIAARVHPRWPTLVRRVMRLDHGWDRPARRYEQLYKNISK